MEPDPSQPSAYGDLKEPIGELAKALGMKVLEEA
jgi:hypothetical protein